MIVSGEHFDDVYHLGVISVSYPHREIHTAALQVLPANIGSICVEFQADIRYEETGQGRPYFMLRVDRRPEDDPDTMRSYTLRVCLGDWLVVLWDKIHVFRDFEFNSTFQINSPGPQHQLHEDSEIGDLERLKVTNDGGLSGIIEYDRPPELPHPHSITAQNLSDSAQWATGVISAEEHEARLSTES